MVLENWLIEALLVMAGALSIIYIVCWFVTKFKGD